MNRIVRSISIAVVFGLAVASCQAGGPSTSTSSPGSSQAAASPKSGGTLRYALAREPIHFDPHVSSGQTSVSLQGSVYDGLVEYNEKGEFVGALAQSWDHPDPLTYVFHLRQGVQFQDGKPFTSDDVIATFNRVKDPKTAAPDGPFVNGWAGYEAPDQSTVKVTLKVPDVNFLDKFVGDGNATLFIASANDIKSGFDFRTKTNGTGAFILASFEPGGQYVLKKNPNYWKKGQPYLDQIIMTAIPDDTARVNALKSGAADFAENIPWQQITPLESGFSVYKYSNTFDMVRFNTSKAPLNDKRVREALNFLVDRKTILQLAFGGQGAIIDGPLQPAGSPYYWKDLEGYYKQDPAKATQLLNDAGYKTPADVPPIELSVFSTFAPHNDPAQVILQELTTYGLKVTFKPVDAATLTANRGNGNFQAQMDGVGFSNNDPDSLRLFFQSTGIGYAVGAKFKNDRLDTLLTQGSQTTDVAQRKTIYREAEQIILDEAPWIFLLWRPSAEAAAKSVKGYVIVPNGLGIQNLGRWENIWLDK
jgi:peptide/nickel transport system substrate-binding protein/glutathione transport system substrate-binding protein